MVYQLLRLYLGFVLFVKGVKITRGNITDLELKSVVSCYSKSMIGHLLVGLDNLRVDDLTLLRNSHLSLTSPGMDLLL